MSSVVASFWKLLISLKLAILVILALTGSLAAATFMESLYDTETARYWVYQSAWFYGILTLLGVQIAAVAISRLPWKRHHIAFLLAHLGILLLLLGSLITDRRGIDGSLRVSEGETTGVVELSDYALMIIEGDKLRKVPVRWIPPNATFKPFSLRDRSLPYDVDVDQFISRADGEIAFAPTEPGEGRPGGGPAIQVRIQGGPMNISQDFWLWAGDPGWKALSAGPALLSIGPHPSPEPGRPRVEFQPEAGSLRYRSVSSGGAVAQGRLSAEKIASAPQTLQAGLKAGVTLSVIRWIPSAKPDTRYAPSRIQYGRGAPPPAIRIVAHRGDDSTAVWLGLGDRATLNLAQNTIEVGYFPQRIVLPFSLRLDRFQIDHYQGTRDPSEYSSQVTVREANGEFSCRISMNEPLELQGFTLYQSSYEDANPRPITSIFSVNRDPGRIWKYAGSLLLVLGTILLFARRYRMKNRATALSLAVSQTSSEVVTS